jgi:hypothetical protein
VSGTVQLASGRYDDALASYTLALGAGFGGKLQNECYDRQMVARSPRSPLRMQVEDVLKGRRARESLSPAQREAAASFYDRVAQGELKGAFADYARLYNEARAAYLRGELQSLEPTLPGFIRNQ